MSATVKDVEAAEAVQVPGAGNGNMKMILMIAIVTLLAAAAPGVVSIIQANVNGGEINDLKNEIEASKKKIDDLTELLAGAAKTADGLSENIQVIQGQVDALDEAGLVDTFKELNETAQTLASTVSNYQVRFDEAGDVATRFQNIESIVDVDANAVNVSKVFVDGKQILDSRKRIKFPLSPFTQQAGSKFGPDMFLANSFVVTDFQNDGDLGNLRETVQSLTMMNYYLVETLIEHGLIEDSRGIEWNNLCSSHPLNEIGSLNYGSSSEFFDPNCHDAQGYFRPSDD